MNSKHSKTGFGLHDMRRQIARRMQLEIERAEYCDRPLAHAEIPDPANTPKEKRPLAA